MRAPPRRLLALFLTLATAGAFVACGSRTGLLAGAAITAEGEEPDGSPDLDALPELDGRPKVDVVRNDCPDADATLVYLVTETAELLSFYPPDATFRKIGVLVCPAPTGATPFSMAVDRKGIAYILYQGSLGDAAGVYRVSTATGACTKTAFDPSATEFNTFGMGFSTDQGGPAETLYIAGDNASGGAAGLGSIDTTTFVTKPIRDFSPQISRAELTGTGSGDLYAFYSDAFASESFVGQIEKTTARVVAENRLAGVTQGQGWAFAYWGGDFWLFTSPTGVGSRVTRYRPSDKSISVMTTYPSIVVGAGVSTCAPQQ